MPKTRRAKKLLSPADFAGDGQPYSEVIVKVSIRILGDGITRSRLAVNVYPDPALESLARKLLESQQKEAYGVNEHGVFGACLSENFSGWKDLNEDYPRIDENGRGRYDKDCLKAMNAYINRHGMEQAARNGSLRRP